MKGSQEMREMRVEVAHPKQYPDATACLTEAFMEDPVISYLFEDEERRPLLLSAFFANRLASRSDADQLLVPTGTDDKFTAALWESPEKKIQSETSYNAAISAAVALLGEQWLSDRLVHLEVLIEAKPDTPHWYLAFIGTRTEARGRGIASNLIRAITEICDKEKLPAYLESSNPENVSLYERHGFSVTGEVTLKGGPTVPLMWREPSFE